MVQQKSVRDGRFRRNVIVIAVCIQSGAVVAASAVVINTAQSVEDEVTEVEPTLRDATSEARDGLLETFQYEVNGIKRTVQDEVRGAGDRLGETFNEPPKWVEQLITTIPDNQTTQPNPEEEIEELLGAIDAGEQVARGRVSHVEYKSAKNLWDVTFVVQRDFKNSENPNAEFLLTISPEDIDRLDVEMQSLIIVAPGGPPDKFIQLEMNHETGTIKTNRNGKYQFLSGMTDDDFAAFIANRRVEVVPDDAFTQAPRESLFDR